MIRLIGGTMIIVGTGFYGLMGVAALRRHVRSLQGLYAGLETMKSEICQRLAPMADVLGELSQDKQNPARSFFARCLEGMGELGEKTFAQIWREAVTASHELGLTPDEELLMAELGSSLGKYSAKEQEAAFTYTMSRLQRFIDRAEDERDRESKLRAFLGVAAGIFAVIILI
jgi:stage III sporulation protein AB